MSVMSLLKPGMFVYNCGVSRCGMRQVMTMQVLPPQVSPCLSNHVCLLTWGDKQPSCGSLCKSTMYTSFTLSAFSICGYSTNMSVWQHTQGNKTQGRKLCSEGIPLKGVCIWCNWFYYCSNILRNIKTHGQRDYVVDVIDTHLYQR